MANFASLRVPTTPVQAVDSGSWVDGLLSKAGDAIDNKVAGDLIAQSLSTGQTPGAAQAAPTGVRQPAPQQSQSYAAPIIPVERRGLDGYLSSIRTAESGGNDGAKNPRSSATGRYQFTEGTWNDLAAKRPELALTADGRLDPNQQERAIRAFTQDNAQTLSRSGIPVNPGTLYAAHFLGAGGATNVLTQSDETPVASIVGADVVDANPFLNGMTVGQFKQWSAKKGGFDAERFASGPVTQGAEGLAGALNGNAQTAQAVNEPMPGVDQTTTGATTAPPIVATPTNSEPVPLGVPVSGNQIAGPVTQLTKQNLSPDLIRRMVQNPVTRQLGLSLAQQVLGGGKATEPWQFVKLANGDLARANQQTGAIELVGNFPKNGKDGGGEAGLNLVYGQDANGATVAFQPLKGGGLRQVELPDGVKLTPGVTNTDLGTSVITRNNKTGAVIDTQNKDVAGVAEQTTQGKTKGEAAAALPATEAAANQVAKQIQELKDDPYLPNMLGSVDARLPNISSDAARVQGRMNQLQGGAFLQARQMLKGGGAITDFEGAKAEDAFVRLNAAQNEKDYITALDDFNEAVQIGLRKLQAQAGAVPTQSNNYKDRYGLE